jgi:phosphatidylglycerol:prolipoprotein diacylglycerol transferase
MSRVLESLIERSHGMKLFGYAYHPYFIATDCALLGTFLTVFVLTRRFEGVSFLSWVGVFSFVLVSYAVFLKFKRSVLKMPSRSFLQDSVLFLLPLYVLISLSVGYPLRLALDILGVVFPVYGGIVRVGCFLGGCCYGIPWERGVLYPARIFEPVSGWRNFRPGANPQTRVMPVQLLESAGQFAIAALAFFFFWNQPAPRGMVLPLWLLCYCALRFTLDFVRRSSTRPRIGAFSEAQVYSIGVALISAVVLTLLK